MPRKLLMLLVVSVLLLAVPSAAMAWKPAGGSVELVYWLGEMEFSGETDDMDGIGLEVDVAITVYEHEFGIPATDALTRSPERLVEMVLAAFPKLEEKLTVGAR